MDYKYNTEPNNLRNSVKSKSNKKNKNLQLEKSICDENTILKEIDLLIDDSDNNIKKYTLILNIT